MIKITAIVGFIILGIVIDCGGVSTDKRGYIGAHYWHNPGAFNNGFKGFVSVFTNAASPTVVQSWVSICCLLIM